MIFDIFLCGKGSGKFLKTAHTDSMTAGSLKQVPILTESDNHTNMIIIWSGDKSLHSGESTAILEQQNVKTVCLLSQIRYRNPICCSFMCSDGNRWAEYEIRTRSSAVKLLYVWYWEQLWVYVLQLFDFHMLGFMFCYCIVIDSDLLFWLKPNTNLLCFHCRLHI